MGREDPQLKLRLTEELKEAVTAAAKANGRSVNAEIVARIEATEAGGGAEAAEWKRRFEEEQEAFIRMQQLYENMAEVAAGFKEVSRGANTHLLGQVRLVEALCSIILSLDAAPTADIIDIVKRMQKAAEDARERFSIPELMQPTSTPTES